MANLQICSRCKSEVDVSFFGLNRKKQPYKTCVNCRSKAMTPQPLKRTDTDFVDDSVSTATPDTNNTETITYKQSLPIDATDVAALLGLNKYKTNLHDLVMKYWKRGDPMGFRTTYSKLQQEGVKFETTKSPDEKITDVCNDKHIVMDFNTLEDVEELTKQLNEEEDLDVDAKDIDSFCNRQMGIKFEKSAIQLYEEQFSVHVEELNKYVKRAFKEDGVFVWHVGGRVDGVIGFDKIIEIKNRKKGFYPSIPLYEILQVYTYMYAVGINQASLVEKYESEIKETSFIYTSGYETYALAKLGKFCTFIEEFINDDVLKKQFTKCCVDDDDEVERINKMLLDKLDLKHMKNAKVTPIKNIITTPEPTPVVVFDVEHTGCREAFVLQLSWGLYLRDGTLLQMKDYYLKPESEIYIHPRATEKTGITFETLLQKENVLPIEELLKEFANDVSKCEVLVSHNMNSDIRTLNKEYVRHNMNEVKVNTYCTMAQTKKFCNLKNKRNQLKNPRLDELHEILFSTSIDHSRAHNSCYDVEMCAKCYFKYLSM